MAAQPYEVVGDVALNLIFQLEGIVGMESLQAAIGVWMVANPIVVTSPLSTDDVNGILKRLTGCTAATGTDVNCYPRGHDTAICYDLNGDPIP